MGLVMHHQGSLIIWNGHLCEGSRLVSGDPSTFCLWTRCGQHDVPANSAHEGSLDEVTCSSCLQDAAMTKQTDCEGFGQMHGTYIGDQPVLKGKTAILKQINDPNQGVAFYPSAFILAQFDDIYDLGVGLTHTWTLWKRTDWEVDAEE